MTHVQQAGPGPAKHSLIVEGLDHVAQARNRLEEFCEQIGTDCNPDPPTEAATQPERPELKMSSLAEVLHYLPQELHDLAETIDAIRRQMDHKLF